MSRTGWKQVERTAAALFGLLRHCANTGGRLDFGGPNDHVVGQVKNPKTLSGSVLTALAKEMEEIACPNQLGVVVVKMSLRRPTPHLIVMTENEWLKIQSLTLQNGSEIPLSALRASLQQRPPGFSDQ